MPKLDGTWLNGKYTVNGGIVEINTSLPYISIENFWFTEEDKTFFSQGEEALQYIQEINEIWQKTNCTIEQAISKFIGIYSC